MYPAKIGGQRTKLVTAIDETVNIIEVENVSYLPDPPNIIVIVKDGNEAVYYSDINYDNGTLTGCIRGFAGTIAKSFDAGADVARFITSKDYNTLIDNITTLDAAIDEVETIANRADAGLHDHDIEDVTGLQSLLDAKSDAEHTHDIQTVTGLQTALDTKATTVHAHEPTDITGLQALLDAKATTVHAHETTDVTGLDAALADKAAANHTHDDIYEPVIGEKATAFNKHFAGTGLASTVARSDHTHTLSHITDFGEALAIELTEHRGAPNGIAPLDGNSKVPLENLPTLQLTETHMAASEVEMLQLDPVEKGDICIRLDTHFLYINISGNNGAMSDWESISGNLTDFVLSINGKTGVVTLNTDEIPEGLLNKYVSEENIYAAIPTLENTIENSHVHSNASVLNNTTAIFTTALESKLAGIEEGANYLAMTQEDIAALTSGGNTSLHYHQADRLWSNLIGKPTSFLPESHGNEAHDKDFIELSDITVEELNTLGLIGATASQLPRGDHTHNYYSLITHTHTIPDVALLTETLSQKSDVTHNHDDAYSALGHTHEISNITNLQTLLDGKALVSHTHAYDDIPGLADDLASLAIADHTHEMTAIVGLNDALVGKSDVGHTHNYADPVHIHAITDITDLQTTLSDKAAVIHAHAITDVTDLQITLEGKSPITHNHDTTYLSLTGKAADSDLLDGHNSDYFAVADHNHDLTYLGISDTATNADALSGLTIHTGRNNESDKIVRTDVNGDLFVGRINTISLITEDVFSHVFVDTGNNNLATTPLSNFKTRFGSALAADKLTTAMTLTLSGDAQGSVTFDGSSDKTLDVNIDEVDGGLVE